MTETTTQPSLSPDRRRELLSQAENLAARLAGGGVERSEVSPLVNLLFYVPGEWAKRLEEGRHLLETLPSSGLRKRSQVMPQRYRHLKQYLGPVLQEVSQPEELRFLLGWLMRCLYVRGRNGGT